MGFNVHITTPRSQGQAPKFAEYGIIAVSERALYKMSLLNAHVQCLSYPKPPKTSLRGYVLFHPFLYLHCQRAWRDERVWQCTGHCYTLQHPQCGYYWDLTVYWTSLLKHWYLLDEYDDPFCYRTCLRVVNIVKLMYTLLSCFLTSLVQLDLDSLLLEPPQSFTNILKLFLDDTLWGSWWGRRGLHCTYKW